MAALDDLVGKTPRVKILNTLARLGSLEFTRAELAREAQLWPMTVNRVFDELIEESLVFEVTAGPRPLYRVNELSARLQLLVRFRAGLALVRRNGLDDPNSPRTIAGRRRALERKTGEFAPDMDAAVRDILSTHELGELVSHQLPLAASTGRIVFEVVPDPGAPGGSKVVESWDTSIAEGAPIITLAEGDT